MKTVKLNIPKDLGKAATEETCPFFKVPRNRKMVLKTNCTDSYKFHKNNLL